MKKIKLLLSVLAIIFFATPLESNAQFGKFLKKAKQELMDKKDSQSARQNSAYYQTQENMDRRNKEQEAKRAALAAQRQEEARQEQERVAAAEAQKKADEAAQLTAVLDEAAANDPQFNDPTVEEGFTVSVADIHKSYALASRDTFYLYPYWKNPAAYNLHNEQNSKELEENWEYVQGRIIARSFRPVENMKDLVPATVGEKSGSISVALALINAYTSMFRADPKSPAALEYLVRALYIDYDCWRNMPMSDKIRKTGIVDSKNDFNLVLRYDDWQSIASQQIYSCYVLLGKNYTIDELYKFAEDYQIAAGKLLKDVADKDDDTKIEAFKKADLAEHLLGRLVEQHPDFSNSDESAQRIDYYETENFQLKGKLHQELKNYFLPKVEMPTETYTWSASITSIAKSKFGGTGLVKVLFLSDKWSIFKDTKWPYDVQFRSVPIAVIYKKGDVYYMSQYNFRQYGNGTSWTSRYEYGASMEIDALNRVVNYK